MNGNKTGMLPAALALLLCLSVGVNAALAMERQELKTQLSARQQRDMNDVVAAMADIEVNLQKLLLAAGASQSVELLGETALLAQHVEAGLSRLPLSQEASSGAMKFAGQMGDYAMTLAGQVSSGSMLTTDDERQLEGMLGACQGLNAHLLSVGERLYSEPMTEADFYGGAAKGWPGEMIAGESGIEYPSLIYDGPFSDGRGQDAPKGLTGARVTREQARQAAARAAGVDVQQVADAADSGGRFEAFGFSADTPAGRLNVQITGQGGHLLFMMPEEAQYEMKLPQEACIAAAQRWLEQMGYPPMERCFVQQYDGMIVANFAAVQDGVLLYPDQVKVQISMEDGRVVGAECSQYLTNHHERSSLLPSLGVQEAEQSLSSRLNVTHARPCVIPADGGERLCWSFEGTFAGETYFVFIDGHTGEAAEILRLQRTQDGETAV